MFEVLLLLQMKWGLELLPTSNVRTIQTDMLQCFAFHPGEKIVLQIIKSPTILATLRC